MSKRRTIPEPRFGLVDLDQLTKKMTSDEGIEENLNDLVFFFRSCTNRNEEHRCYESFYDAFHKINLDNRFRIFSRLVYFGNEEIAVKIPFQRRDIMDFFHCYKVDKPHLISEILNITDRTFRRWSEIQSSEVSSESKERLTLFAKLMDRGEKIFGSKEDFVDWLNEENHNFDNTTPIKSLDTIFGFEKINRTLSQIEYGFPA